MLPVLCPGCRSPVPADALKCPWCGRNVNQGGFDDDDCVGPQPAPFGVVRERLRVRSSS